MTGHDQPELVAADIAAICGHTRHAAILARNPGDLAFLDDVHPHGRARPRIAPGHRIVARGAAARLPEPAQNRVARPVEIDDRHDFLDAGGRDEFGRHALKRVGLRRALVAPHLVFGLRQHDHATGAEHDVVIEVLAQRLVERARLLVDRRRRVLEVVRANDGGVASRVAAAQPALFQHGDIGDAKIFTKVIGRGQTMPARAHDDHIVCLFRLGRGPGALPPHVVAQGLAGYGKDGIAFHARVFLGGFGGRSWSGS